MGRRREGRHRRLGAALLLRHDRARPEVQRGPVVRAVAQGEPDGAAHQGPVGRDGRVRPAHEVKLVIDEWGSWHPAGTEINPRHLFEQMGTLRDALVAAISLDTFNRHADKVVMANVAQLVNNLHSLFLADGDKFVATPTFHVYTMYRPHQDARAVRIDVQAPELTFRAGGRAERIVRLAGSASRSRDGRATLTLAHLHASEPAEIVVRLKRRLGAGRCSTPSSPTAS